MNKPKGNATVFFPENRSRTRHHGYTETDAERPFLPRDVMRKRGLCCRPVSVRPDVRPSVCLFDTLAYCIWTAEGIAKFLYRPSSHMILVFLTTSADTQFLRKHLPLGHKIHGGVGKFAIFD